jgi:hypothetical protein
MKTILLGVVAALALTSLPAVHAEDSSVNIQSPRASRYFLQEGDFRPYRNSYQLTNGQKIVFKQHYSLLYAQLADGAYVRIYATSPTNFMTDSGVHFTFRDEGENLTISDFQKLPLAANVPANGVMVASISR